VETTLELTGPALDWAVEYVENKCLEVPALRGYSYLQAWHNDKTPKWSSNWSAGGFIIDREDIEFMLMQQRRADGSYKRVFRASI
jgi:Protein of unknown function (DUF2591)